VTIVNDDTFTPDPSVYLNARDVLRELDSRIADGYRELRDDPADPDDGDHVRDLDCLAAEITALERARRLLAGSCRPEWTSSPIRHTTVRSGLLRRLLGVFA
jgi:hypothetical protein